MAYIVHIKNKQGELLAGSKPQRTYDDARALAEAYLADVRYPDAHTAIITDASTGKYAGSITIVGGSKS